jgi:hypothetical protein
LAPLMAVMNGFLVAHEENSKGHVPVFFVLFIKSHSIHLNGMPALIIRGRYSVEVGKYWRWAFILNSVADQDRDLAICGRFMCTWL